MEIIVSAALTTVLVLTQAAGASGFQSFPRGRVEHHGGGDAFCAMATGLVAAPGPSEVVPRVTIVEIIAFILAVFTL